MKNGAVGLFAMAVLEDADIGSGRKDLANTLSGLNHAVMGIIISDEAANETDDDVLGRIGGGC